MNLRLGVGLLLGFIVSCSGAADSDVSNPVLQLGEVVIEGELPATAEPAEPTEEATATTEEHFDFDGVDSCGCGRALELPAVERARPAKAGDVLVWFAAQEATLRLDGDSGAIVGSEPGRLIYASDKQWKLSNEITAYDRVACAHEEESSPKSHAWRTTLTTDGAEIELVAARGDASDPTAEFSRYTELRASIGPLLFLQLDESESFCDRTHASESRIHVFDVERRAFVDLASQVGDWSNAVSLARARAGSGFDAAPGSSAIVPVFGDSGLAFARHLIWTHGNGKEWIKASRPIELDPEPDLLPRSIAPYARVPAGLAKFRSEHSEYPIGGFSVIAR